MSFFYCEHIFLIYIFSLKNLHDELLNILLKLPYNTTTTISRGAKYSDNPEALKKK